MDTLLKPLLLLPWPDWLALALFFGGAGRWLSLDYWLARRWRRRARIDGGA